MSKYFLSIGLDKIYSSTSNRAIQTAEPTCRALGLEAQLLDFANEAHAWRDFTIANESGRTWLFQSGKIRKLFADQSIRSMGYKWYEHSELAEYRYERGMERVYGECDSLLSSLGYDHIRYSGQYRATSPNDKKVALFAHEGFGKAFLSCFLDIPYPYVCNHFNLCHAGVTVIELPDKQGDVTVKLLQISQRGDHNENTVR